jgi:N-acetyl-anhydromuramoyl-L-alanine amidase
MKTTNADSVVLRGVVRDKDTSDPVFYAKARLPAIRTALFTTAEGRYKFVLPVAGTDRSIRLIVLKSGYWPRITHIPVPKGARETIDTEVVLAPLPAFMLQGLHGYLVSLLGPRLLAGMLSLTRLELLLGVATGMFLLPPLLLLAIAHGASVPGTEWDERIREQMLTRRWVMSDRPVVFQGVRAHYLPNVKYLVPKGEHRVGHDVSIAAGSEVAVAAGAVFKLEPDAGFLVRGILKVEGTADQKVVFQRADPNRRWSNLTFWDTASTGSSLVHCRIEGGGGRRTSGAEGGAFVLHPGGTPNGGGVLMHNTTVILDQVEFADCQAAFGGAAYLRNTPDRIALPGSRFKNVRVLRCLAEYTSQGNVQMSGGGAFYIQRTNPHFEDCLFRDNHAKGRFSCGGAIYLGRDAQAVFNNCQFVDNSSAYSGGAIYARECGESGESMLSGLNVHGGRMADNRAKATGGAVSAENTRIRLTDVEFTSNAVTTVQLSGDADAKATGGAVYLIYTREFDRRAPATRAGSVVEGCIFTGNRAEVPEGTPSQPDNIAGGALALVASIPLDFRFTNLRFNSNAARYGRQVAIPPSSYIRGWDGQWNATIDPGQALSAAEAVRVIWPAESGLLSIDASHALPAPCYGDRPDATGVNALVLHHISAVNLQPANPYDLEKILGIFTGASVPGEAPTSAHYLIDRKGRVYALVDEKKRAWHAGLSRLATGEENVNDFSIGIEIMMTKDAAPTPQQYITLARLVADIQQRHPAITDERIVGHAAIRAAWNEAHPDNQAPPKDDPGPLFDWHLLRAHLQIIRQGPQT